MKGHHLRLRRFVQVILVWTLLAVTALAAQTERWSEQKARDWYARQPWLVGANISYLDVAVSRTADGKTIFIKAVNTDRTAVLLTTINIKGVTPAPRAELKTLTAPSLDVANSFSRPNAVSIQKRMLTSGRTFVVNLPKHSVSVIVLKTKLSKLE